MIRFANATYGVLALLVLAAAAPGQSSTTFTYQGRLMDGGQPANGNFVVEFALFDAAMLGNQVGSTVTVNPVVVSDGFLTVQLDFGAAAFDNSSRWLEITVDGVVLTPRQPITRAPYAIQTRGIFVNDALTFAGIGRPTPVTTAEIFGLYRNTTLFGGMYVETASTGEPFYGYSAGGDVDAYHYFNSATNRWQLFVDGGERLVVSGNGTVGIGTTAPERLLQVSGGDPGLAPNTSAVIVAENNSNTYINVLTPANNQSGILFGNPIGGNAAGAIIYNATNTPDGLELRTNGNITRMSIRDDGHVGIGTAPSFAQLDVHSDGTALHLSGGTFLSPALSVLANSPWAAAQFIGHVDVAGLLTKSSGSFKIDHPLDPTGKYLFHSFVESPDMMNIYNGNVVTDDDGCATIELPDYFEALNRDFRYQLTVIDDSDDFVLAKVVEEIEDNSFRIRTSKPSVKVSWQVTGVRDDAYARMNPIVVEQIKPDGERGLYLHPEAFGRPRSEAGVGCVATKPVDGRVALGASAIGSVKQTGDNP